MFRPWHGSPGGRVRRVGALRLPRATRGRAAAVFAPPRAAADVEATPRTPGEFWRVGRRRRRGRADRLPPEYSFSASGPSAISAADRARIPRARSVPAARARVSTRACADLASSKRPVLAAASTSSARAQSTNVPPWCATARRASSSASVYRPALLCATALTYCEAPMISSSPRTVASCSPASRAARACASTTLAVCDGGAEVAATSTVGSLWEGWTAAAGALCLRATVVFWSAIASSITGRSPRSSPHRCW